jgi:hypothetical protein
MSQISSTPFVFPKTTFYHPLFDRNMVDKYMYIARLLYDLIFIERVNPFTNIEYIKNPHVNTEKTVLTKSDFQTVYPHHMHTVNLDDEDDDCDISYTLTINFHDRGTLMFKLDVDQSLGPNWLLNASLSIMCYSTLNIDNRYYLTYYFDNSIDPISDYRMRELLRIWLSMRRTHVSTEAFKRSFIKKRDIYLLDMQQRMIALCMAGHKRVGADAIGHNVLHDPNLASLIYEHYDSTITDPHLIRKLYL